MPPSGARRTLLSVPPSLPTDPELARLAAAALNAGGGFLPDRTPLHALPPPFDAHADALDGLADRYHAEGASVRPWLDATFAAWRDDHARACDALDDDHADKLMTVVSFLAHAYRWDSAPPRAAEYRRDRVELPPGLRGPWERLARRLGVPRVGNLYAMLLCNWRIPGRGGAEAYAHEELVGDRIELLHTWLRAPEAAEVRAFVLTVVETEALGAAAVRTALALLDAAAREDAAGALALLGRLRGEVERFGAPFRRYIQLRRMTRDHFLTLVQPTFIWAIDEGTGLGPLEGASGPQVGCIQAVDSVLGVARDTRMGRAILHSRSYMPARHRRLLDALDARSQRLRGFVAARGDAELTGAFNACVEAMQAWRRVHHRRGAWYLEGDTPGAVAHYTSTGLVVQLTQDRVRAFDAAMTERAEETARATLPRCPFAALAAGRAARPAG